MTFTHFMPHWQKEDKCFEDEQVEYKDRTGQKISKPWQHDKSMRQISYEEILNRKRRDK
jgi:hypothetical protein